MPIIVSDAGSEPGQVTVTNTDAGTSQTAQADAQGIAEAIRAQQQES